MKPLWVTGLSSYKIINDQLIFASGWKEGRMKQIVIKKSGQRTVPNVWVRGKHLGGSDDVVAAIQNGRLQKLLSDE